MLVTHSYPPQPPPGAPLPPYPIGQPGTAHNGHAASSGPRHGENGEPTAVFHPGSIEEQRRRQEEQWAADLYWRWLRAAVASRMELFNSRHAEHAWRLRHSFGVGPHAVAMLYIDPDPRPAIKIAGKLVADSDQVTDAGRVLYDLCGLAREVAAAGQDPRAEMSEHPEPMGTSAAYVGVALSTLDTPAGLWREVRSHAAGGSLSIPGRVFTLLADDSLLLADRLEHHHPEHYQVTVSQPLEQGWGGTGRVSRYLPDLARLEDAATRPLWLRLHELHTLLAGAHHAR